MEPLLIDMTLQWVDKFTGKTTMSGTNPGKDYLPVFMVEVQNKKHGMITYRSTIPDFYLDVISKFFVKDIGMGKIIVAVNDPNWLLIDFQSNKKNWEFIKTLANACPYFLVKSTEKPYVLGIEYDADALPSKDLNIKFEDIEIEDLNQGRKGMTGGGGRGKGGKGGGLSPAPEPKPDPDKWVNDNPVSPKEGSQSGGSPSGEQSPGETSGESQGDSSQSGGQPGGQSGQASGPGQGQGQGSGQGEGGEGEGSGGDGQGQGEGEGGDGGEGSADDEGEIPGSCQECADNAEAANESMSDSDSPEDSMEKAKEAADNAKKAQEMARESNDEADKKAAEDARQSAEEAIEKAKQNVEKNSSEEDSSGSDSDKKEKLDELDQMKEDLKSDFEKGMEDIRNEMDGDSEDTEDTEDSEDSEDEKDSDETFMKLMKKLYKLQPLAKTDEEFAELEIIKMEIRKKFGAPVKAAAAEAENTKYIRSSVIVDHICKCEYHPVSTWECKPCWRKRIGK